MKMKNFKALFTAPALFTTLIIGLLVITGCQGFLEPPTVADGNGTLFVSINGEDGRTILPSARLDKYALELYTGAGATTTAYTGDYPSEVKGSVGIVLPAGTYRIVVKGYVGEDMVAQGSEQDIIVAATSVTATVALTPEATGTGTFSWDFTDERVTGATIAIYAIADDVYATNLATAGNVIVGTQDLSSGVYNVKFTATATTGSGSWWEILYIYPGLTSSYGVAGLVEQEVLPPIYQTPAAGRGYFYLNLNNWKDVSVADGTNISGVAVTGTLAADGLTANFTIQNQRLNIKLSAAQVALIKESPSVTVTIIGSGDPATQQFRYHLGDATVGASWDVSAGSGDIAFSGLASATGITKTLAIANPTRNLTHFILQQRGTRGPSSVTIKSIRIDYPLECECENCDLNGYKPGAAPATSFCTCVTLPVADWDCPNACATCRDRGPALTAATVDWVVFQADGTSVLPLKGDKIIENWAGVVPANDLYSGNKRNDETNPADNRLDFSSSTETGMTLGSYKAFTIIAKYFDAEGNELIPGVGTAISSIGQVNVQGSDFYNMSEKFANGGNHGTKVAIIGGSKFNALQRAQSKITLNFQSRNNWANAGGTGVALDHIEIWSIIFHYDIPEAVCECVGCALNGKTEATAAAADPWLWCTCNPCPGCDVCESIGTVPFDIDDDTALPGIKIGTAGDATLSGKVATVPYQKGGLIYFAFADVGYLGTTDEAITINYAAIIWPDGDKQAHLIIKAGANEWGTTASGNSINAYPRISTTQSGSLTIPSGTNIFGKTGISFQNNDGDAGRPSKYKIKILSIEAGGQTYTVPAPTDCGCGGDKAECNCEEDGGTCECPSCEEE